MRLFLLMLAVAFAPVAAQAETTKPVSTGAPHACGQFYPVAAMSAGVTGVAEIGFRIGVDGKTHDQTVKTSSGNADLDQAALACIAGWLYLPARSDGQPVDVPWSAQVRWGLDGDSAQALADRRCDDVMHTADAKRLSGVVVVKMTLGADGVPRDLAVKSSSGDPRVDKLAMACVAEWKYLPALKNFTPAAVPWETKVVWNAPGDTAAPVPTAFVPDVTHLEPRIHRLGIDTQLYAQVAAGLGLTTGGQTWRCRQVFMDFADEHHVRHWIAQGWDDSDDFLYARVEGSRYIAVHIKADGRFVAALDMNDETGIGQTLGYTDVKDLLEHEVKAWNASVAEK